MSGTRALFASIGASVLLVAAAALSLLAVSAVFAFGGWSDPVAESAGQAALVLSEGELDDRSAARQKAMVLPARTRPRSERPPARAMTAARTRTARAAEQPAMTAPTKSRRARVATSAPPVVSTPQSSSAAPPAARRKTAGDSVRTVGDDLSGTVQNTGDALAQITDPLLPPVASAVQKTLNLVAELLDRATDGLGGAVDGLTRKK